MSGRSDTTVTVLDGLLLRGGMLAGIVVLVMGVSLPLLYLVLRAFDAGPAAFGDLLFRARNLELLWNTVRLTAGVLCVSTVIAFPLAWLTTRTSMRGKRVWALVGVLPLAIPSYLMAYAVLSMGGNIGIVSQITDMVFPRFQGFWGAVAILSLCNFPYLFFNLRASLLTLDPALEDVAYSLGHTHRQILMHVFLPQLRPAFLSGGLLITLHVFSEFAAVSQMHYETLSYALYNQYISGMNPSYGACIALMLISVTAFFVIVEGRFLRKVRLDKAGSTTKRALKPFELGRWAPAAYGYALVIFLLSVFAPVGAMFFWAAKADMTYLWTDLSESLKGSIFASLPAAVLAAIVVIPIVYMSVRMPSRLTLLMERVAYLGYSIPALAFALGLVSFSLKLAPGMYQTLFLLVYAYLIHYLAEAIGPIRSALYQTSPGVEEAARSLGCSRFQAILRTTLPMIRNGVLISMAFVFLSCMKELHLTIILSPLGYNTLALEVWSYIEEAYFAEAAPFALTILLFSGMFVGVLLIQERKYA
ncbi:MAG: iron ABC transporter permease [Candidatus Hydrogenedentota bacterium]